ncbi:MAG: SPOR domain-containing protein [Sphingomicrobium sp.]
MSPKHLVAAACVALLSASVSAQSVKAGIEAWQRADYSAAVAIWRPLAEKGDADAQFNLGQAYRLGRGVPLNLGAAQTWFERAATSGHVDAETTLGLLLFQNGDRVSGLKWLRRAAEQGEPRAMLVYGTALYNGDAVTQDRLLGYSFISRAAAAGLPPAKDTLAQVDQLMTPADREKALALAHSIPSGSPVAAATSPEKPKPERHVRTAEARHSAPSPASAKHVEASPKAASAVPKSGGWRIQLGAFSQRGSAEALYRRVSGKAALAGRGPSYVASGSVIRLQVGPFESRAAAETACRSVGTACFPVPAK